MLARAFAVMGTLLSTHPQHGEDSPVSRVDIRSHVPQVYTAVCALAPGGASERALARVLAHWFRFDIVRERPALVNTF